MRTELVDLGAFTKVVLASIQSARTESKKALGSTLQAHSAQEQMEASTSHLFGNTSSHSVQHLEPPETRSSTSQRLRSNGNFHLSLDIWFTPLSPPSSQHLANSSPFRIGDFEMNINPSTHLPLALDLEDTWSFADGRSLLSPLHPMASFLSEDT
ncbi:hypothetical protein BKA70DRAFT_1426083 [Coprinopsis sp. MPI-PUGE-AT-0042]|nr:hypothetical protein BKA70DRAFT_1426083 [Coprinopsis sp. MPI-PUGE-AT-0042]